MTEHLEVRITPRRDDTAALRDFDWPRIDGRPPGQPVRRAICYWTGERTNERRPSLEAHLKFVENPVLNDS